MECHDQFARLPLRLAHAGDECGEWQAARAGMVRKLHLGIERQQRRDAVGGRRGVADVSRDRTGVLDLAAADLARRLFQAIEQRRQMCLDDVAPGRGGAQSPAGGSLGNTAQGCDSGNVEHVFGDGTAYPRRVEVGATGQHRERSGQCLKSLFKASGSEVFAHIVRVRTMTQRTCESNE